MPSWIIGVHWNPDGLLIHVFPWFSSWMIAVPLVYGKLALLVLILGSVPVLLRALSLVRHCTGSHARTRIIQIILGVMLLIFGSFCLEPSPLYLQRVPVQFDIGRNALLSLFPLIRFMGLVLFVIGLGRQGRNRIASEVDAGIVKISLLPLRKTIPILISGGFALGILFAIVGFQRLPSIRDEIAALFQAGIFATGRIVAEAPIWHEFMDMSPILTNPSWSSMYPPIWSAILALGGNITIQWMINPFLSGIIAVLIFVLVRRHLGGYVAWVAVSLLFTSTFFLRLSGSFMSHHLTLAMLLVAYVLVFTTARRTILTGAISGCALAFALGTRPWSTVCLGSPLLLVFARDIWRREYRTFWTGCIIGFIISTLPVLYYNELSTGSWLKTGYAARLGSKGGMGFGEKAMGLHTPLLGFLHDAGRLFRLNIDLFGLPVPGLLIVVLGLFCGVINPTGSYLLFGFFILWFGSGLYWWYEHWFGPRYLFEGIPVLVWFSSLGIDAMRRDPEIKPFILSGFAVAICWALVSAVPHELHDLSNGYGEVDRKSVENLRDPSLAGAAVIIQDSDENAWPHDTYTSAFLAMVLDDFGGAIMLRDLGPRNKILEDLLPSSAWYYYCHGDQTGSGTLFRIDGPDLIGDSLSTDRYSRIRGICGDHHRQDPS